MNHSFCLLLRGGVLVAGCGPYNQQPLPTPALGNNQSIVRYQLNGQAFDQEARVSYQPAVLPARAFDVLTVEAGDSARAAGGAYLQVAFLKGAGRPTT